MKKLLPLILVLTLMVCLFSFQANAETEGDFTYTVTDGKAYTEGGNLAGSTATLFDCVRCAISFGIPEYDAVKMASEVPATLMGLNKGKIAVGYDADYILVDRDFNLVRAVASGRV